MLIILLTSNSYLSAQECDENNVLTNPENPQNPLHPFYENIFDWRLGSFECFYLNQFNSVPNPYLTGQGGVSHLFPHDDYQPEDGWELLFVDLGLDRFGDVSDYRSGNLVIVLYNKYRSFIRVFVRVVQMQQTDIVEMELSFDNLSPSYYSSLLGASDRVRKPLKNFDPEIRESGAQEFVNLNPNHGFTHWYYSDFPVNYDPCSCMPLSLDQEPPELRLKLSLVSESLIQLSGHSNGMATMVERNTINQQQQSNWNNFFGTSKKVQNSIEAGVKAFKTYSSFAINANRSADTLSGFKSSQIQSGITQLASLLSDDIPLLRHAPYVGEALAIIGTFVGAGRSNSPTNIRFPPLSMELHHSFIGNITTSSTYGVSKFFLPGSVISAPSTPSNADYNHKYPIYNEILGVYTLLEKPKINLYNGFTRIYAEEGGANAEIQIRQLIDIDGESIKLAINPAAKLNLIEAFVQLSWITDFRNDDDTTKSVVTNHTGSSYDFIWASELIPLSCIDEYPVFFDFLSLKTRSKDPVTQKDRFSFIVDSIDFSLVLHFENENGDRIIHKSLWDTDVTPIQLHSGLQSPPDNVDIHYDWFSMPQFLNKDYSFFLLDDNLFLTSVIHQTKRSKNSVTIEQAQISDNELEVSAGNFVEILPNTEVLQNSTIRIYTPALGCSNNDFLLASNSEIESTCNSEEYLYLKIPKRFSQDSIELDINHLDNIFIEVYPNPATDYINLNMNNFQNTSVAEVSLVDLNGRLIYNKKLDNLKENNSFNIDLSSISAGIYIMKISNNGNNIYYEKLIIK